MWKSILIYPQSNHTTFRTIYYYQMAKRGTTSPTCPPTIGRNYLTYICFIQVPFLTYACGNRNILPLLNCLLHSSKLSLFVFEEWNGEVREQVKWLKREYHQNDCMVRMDQQIWLFYLEMPVSEVSSKCCNYMSVYTNIILIFFSIEQSHKGANGSKHTYFQ